MSHPRGGGRHPPQRAQRQPDPHRAGDPGDQQRGPEHHRLHQLQPAHGVRDGLQRQPGDQHITGRATDAHHPVLGERGEPDTAAPGVRRHLCQHPAVGGGERHRGLGPLADHGGPGHRSAQHTGAEGAGGLSTGVGATVVPAGRPGRVQARREVAADGGQLLIEPTYQETFEGGGGGHADREAAQRQQSHQPEGEPCPEAAQGRQGGEFHRGSDLST